MAALVFGLGPLVLGFALDLILGDPPWLYHPVRAMGALITRLEELLRLRNTPASNRKSGLALAALCVGIALGCGFLLVFLSGRLGSAFDLMIQVFLFYQLIAVRDLYIHSMRVFAKLQKGDLPGARKAVARIVGRDTAGLDEGDVIRAAVETVAENTADGIVAPLFYLALGGYPLGLAFKMVSTLDSMVGYKNERYIDFGRASARLDDIANWLPARLGALLMVLAAGLCGLDLRGAFAVWRRDRRAHASPNSAQTESACAGALGIRLGGPNFYGGKLVEKPAIGDDDRPAQLEDIRRANNLMLATAVLSLAVAVLLRTGILVLFR